MLIGQDASTDFDDDDAPLAKLIDSVQRKASGFKENDKVPYQEKYNTLAIQ